jgi:RHS repeat-associated protein
MFRDLHDNLRRRRFTGQCGTSVLQRGASAAAIAAMLLAPTCAAAQQNGPVSPPPVFQQVDGNGVELQTGKLVLTLANISVGAGGPGSLAYNWGTDKSLATETSGGSMLIDLLNSSHNISVTIGGSTETFSGAPAAASYAQDQGRPSTLTYNAGNDTYIYTRGDGTAAVFSRNIPGGVQQQTNSQNYMLVSLTYPAGQALTYNYVAGAGLVSVTSSLGYQLRFTPGSSGTPSKVVAFNMSSETCEPLAVSCTLAGTWPTISQDPVTGDIVGPLGPVHLTVTNNQTTYQYNYTFPSGRQANYTIYYDSTNNISHVMSFSDGKGTWTYQYPANGTVTLAFNPDNGTPHVYSWSSTNGLVALDQPTAGGGPSTAYTYDSFSRLTKVVLKDSSGTVVTESDYGYDARGNVTTMQRVSATPGSPATLTATASYPASCANAKTCNQPDYTIDVRGKRTDYTYDPIHGGVTSVTQPADANGVHPQIRYSYTALSANYRNGSGATVSGTPVYLLTGTSQCTTTASCTNTADESKTTIAYGANDALLPTSVTTAAGDGSVSSTTTTSYYPTGDKKIVDGPLAGSADTTRYYYDLARNVTGVIGADPDGAGPLPRQASRATYNGDGQVTLAEAGTAGGQGDGDMATFQPLQQVATSYDAQGRKAASAASAGGTAVSQTQYSYTNGGALQCAAVRMNPAVYASLPASACTQGTAGASGPDRITRYSYDAQYRVTSVATAVGTALERTEFTKTYETDAQVKTLTDANGNVTTFGYDGLRRPVTVNYPSPTSPGTSSSTDYEQIVYDAGSMPTQKRNRDGAWVTYAYDDLGRVTSKAVPASASFAAGYNVFYGYDLRGLLAYARYASPSGAGITNAFDALGRQKSTTTNMDGTARTITYQYDAAGNRTAVNATTGYAMNFSYDPLSRMTALVDGNFQQIVSFAYDAAGRRQTLALGPGGTSSQSYGYDGADRLTSLSHTIGGTPGYQASSFTYNPASQIASRTTSNDALASNTAYNVSRGYSANGLNQYAAAGGATFSYDGNGNLVSDGSTSFVYDSENRLVSASGGKNATLSYDPLGRLWQVSGPSGTTRFEYDGDRLLEEFDGSGNWVRLHAWGPGTDEPLVWYEATGGAVRRYLHADERGSIVAATDDSGTALGTNGYDAWGIPNATTIGAVGRFGYTGQAWLPDLGMYYYKARMYSPTLGRFLQTDPIGYAGGTNLHAYVGNDPVNRLDPQGTQCAGIGNATCTDAPDLGPPIEVWGRRISENTVCIGSACASMFRPALGGTSDGFGFPRINVTPAAFRKSGGCPAVPSSRPVGKRGQLGAILHDPDGAMMANEAADMAKEASAKRFPHMSGWNDARDAYRHFYWSFAMTRLMGAERAAAFGNAHEANYANNPHMEEAMDTWNNAVGRAMAADPAYKNMSTADAAETALQNGCLRSIK